MSESSKERVQNRTYNPLELGYFLFWVAACQRLGGKGTVFAHESDRFVEKIDTLLVCLHGRDKVAFSVHFDGLCGETKGVIECLAESTTGGNGGEFRVRLCDCSDCGGHVAVAVEVTMAGSKRARGGFVLVSRGCSPPASCLVCLPAGSVAMPDFINSLFTMRFGSRSGGQQSQHLEHRAAGAPRSAP